MQTCGEDNEMSGQRETEAKAESKSDAPCSAAGEAGAEQGAPDDADEDEDDGLAAAVQLILGIKTKYGETPTVA